MDEDLHPSKSAPRVSKTLFHGSPRIRQSCYLLGAVLYIIASVLE
jgi:hypothetical protein